MATNSLEGSGTLLWIRVSGLWASNHQEVGRNRKLAFRLSCSDSPKELWRSISLNCAITNKRWPTGGGPRDVSNRIKLLRDVLGVCSQVDTLYYSQNRKREECPYKVVVSPFVVNGNYGRWGIGIVPLVTTAPRPRKFLGIGFSTDPTPCFSREWVCIARAACVRRLPRPSLNESTRSVCEQS